jgi:flagellar hook-associated protein 2
MSSISSALLSQATALTGPQAFTGNSKFASGLQQVLSRAVGIASLPLQSLEAGLTTLNGRQSAIQNLDSIFTNLQTAASSLDTSLQNNLRSSAISDASVLSATVSSTAATGTYSVEVINPGSYSTALSTAGATPVSDPATQGISASTSLTLTVGSGTPVTITPASGSLQDLVSAINSSGSAGVHAALVNVGSSEAADYRLSLTATGLGASEIQLTGDEGNLIDNSTPGALASYKVNGISTAVTSTSRTLTLAPGLTVNLLGQSPAGVATTITVRNNPAGAVSSLNAFASAYNQAVDALAAQHGQSGGALQGDSLVGTLSSVLSRLGTYSNGSPAQSLAAYGLTLDKTGHLLVDSTALTTAANANFSGFLATLGGTSTGGFLKAAADSLNGLEDTTNGTLKLEESNLKDLISTRQNRIADEQSRLTQLQADLTARIAKADAAIAALESQSSYVNGLFYSITGNNNNPTNSPQSL